jgi:signal transduction histidine kinase
MVGWHARMLSRRLHQGKFDPVALVDAADTIASGAAESVAAIEELSDLTRLDAGQTLPLERMALDLAALVESRVGRRNASRRRQVLVQASSAVLQVDADPARLGRVLDNLLDNADKYSAEDQPIEVSVGQESHDGRDWAVVRVQDHGIGIAATDLPHIFERYYRGANVASAPGQGLGLASAYQIVSLHGGALSVESQEHVGSPTSTRHFGSARRRASPLD